MSNISHKKAYFINVDSEFAGQRLDNFLISTLKNIPKSHVYKIIRKGEVRINKGRVKANTRLKANDVIRIPPIKSQEINLAVPSDELLRNVTNCIIYEDENLIVINKLSGMPVHSGTNSNFGIIELLRHAIPETPYLELIHRLDKQASGCLMVAKSRKFLLYIQDILSRHDPALKKKYMILIKGQWQGGQVEVDTKLLPMKGRFSEKQSVVDERGKQAITQFSPVKIYQQASLMSVYIKTGRLHQIRAHAAHINHPIAGDDRYGEFEFNKAMRKNVGLKRLFLHADSILIPQINSKKVIQIDAKLPHELESVLSVLDNFKPSI